MTALTDHMHQMVPFTPEEKAMIERSFRSIEVAKGDLWIRQGKVCDQVGYVVSGGLRNFYIDEAGNEMTCYFVGPDQFISSFTSFLTNTPTCENIAALEDTVMRVITKKDIEELSARIPNLQIFRRLIAENLFISMEKRIVMLQSQSAVERYENMLRDNPEIVLCVPLQYTASFLGITPQHLSRLRKEWVR